MEHLQHGKGLWVGVGNAKLQYTGRWINTANRARVDDGTARAREKQKLSCMPAGFDRERGTEELFLIAVVASVQNTTRL